MFSRINRLRKTAVFRLTLWYSAVLVLSCFAVLGLTYSLLFTSLRRDDHTFVRSKLGHLGARYDEAGLQATVKEIEDENAFGEEEPYFARLAEADNRTLYVSLPARWPGFDVGLLARQPPPPPGTWINLTQRNGRDVIETASHILADGRFLQAGKSSGERNHVLGHALRVFAIVIGPLVLSGFVGGLFLARRHFRPVRHLIRAAKVIVDTGRVDARVSLPVRRPGNELDELVALFNRMLERIESVIAGMREALDNVAHDLRTPLTRLRGTAEAALLPGHDPGAAREALAECLEESDEILTMLTTLMDISEAETGTMKLAREPVDLVSVLADAADLYRFVAEEKAVTVSLPLPPELVVVGDRRRLRQVFANLLDNAVKYTPWGGRVSVAASARNGLAVVVVADTGPGIPPEEMPHIWERLYRGDKSRSQPGLGLGLSLVRAMVQAHGGTVEAVSAPGAGARFTVVLPTASAASPADPNIS